jgi:hypothetical protein
MPLAFFLSFLIGTMHATLDHGGLLLISKTAVNGKFGAEADQASTSDTSRRLQTCRQASMRVVAA